MIKQIANKEILIDKAEMLKKRDFKPGSDGMTASGAELWIEINGKRLCREIENGSYEPMPAMSFKIAKKSSGFRGISKLTAIDSVIQYAAIDAVSEICEEHFSPKSFAYRQGKGIGAAIEMFCLNARSFRFAAKVDPTACFDNIDYDTLENAVNDIIGSKKVASLLMRFARMPYMENDEIINPEKGIIQGAPISPLLCNIYLNELDKFMESNGIEFIRYADDVVIFANTLDETRKSCDKIREFLKNKLKLDVNERKFKIDSPVNMKYLGYRFSADKKGVIALEADAPDKTSYRLWHESELYNGKGITDILSNGILRQKDYSLIFESDSRKINIPVESVDVINIYSDVVFDSGFLKKAFNSGIEINVFEKSGKLIGTFSPFTSLKSPKMTHEMLNAYYNEARRLEFAKQFVLGSIHNLRLNIRYYNKQNPSDFFEKAVNKTYETAKEIKEADSYEKLLILEAKVRGVYYSCFDSFIENEDFCFEKRSRKPPRNEVNAMMSFGNTVLYNLIATEINKSSLDIRIGFLHAANNRKASLNLDVAELFKPLIVDRTVFTLVNRNLIKKCHFEHNENGAVMLSREGKQIFLKAFYEKLDTVITEKDKKMNYRRIIKAEIFKISGCIRENKKYSSFRQVR